MPRYCSTGGQPGLEGWTRETSSHVLQVTHRRGQHRLSGQAAHPLSQPCPWGLRSWEEFRARGPLGLAEELALGYDGPCLKRGMVHLGMPPRPQSGGTAAYHHPIVPNFSRAVRVHTTIVGPHPAQQRPGLPPPSSIHVAKASYSSLVCVTPHLGCVWDTQMHARTLTHAHICSLPRA